MFWRSHPRRGVEYPFRILFYIFNRSATEVQLKCNRSAHVQKGANSARARPNHFRSQLSALHRAAEGKMRNRGQRVAPSKVPMPRIEETATQHGKSTIALRMTNWIRGLLGFRLAQAENTFLLEKICVWEWLGQTLLTFECSCVLPFVFSSISPSSRCSSSSNRRAPDGRLSLDFLDPEDA